MKTATKQIEIWYDETSDRGGKAPAWTVSLCDQDGEEIQLISTHRLRGAAKKSAAKEAQARGLTAYSRSGQGVLMAI